MERLLAYQNMRPSVEQFWDKPEKAQKLIIAK
jgi:hypothetical protein